MKANKLVLSRIIYILYHSKLIEKAILHKDIFKKEFLLYISIINYD